MKKLFLLLIILSFSLFSEELKMRKVESIVIINFESENSQILQEKKSENLFSGIDVDRILRDVSEGTGRYSKEAKLATEMCKRDKKLMQGYYRIFSKEELEQIAKESSLITNEKLKNEIRALYNIDEEYKKLTPKE